MSMNTSESSDDVDLIDLGTDSSSTLDNEKLRPKPKPSPDSWMFSMDQLMAELSNKTSTKDKYIVYSVGNPTLFLKSLDPQQLSDTEAQLLDKHLTDVKMIPPHMPMCPDPHIVVQGMKRDNVKQRASRATHSRGKPAKGVFKGRYRAACGEVRIYPKHDDVRKRAVPNMDPDSIPSTSRGLAPTPRPSTPNGTNPKPDTVLNRKGYTKRQASKASTSIGTSKGQDSNNKGQASKDVSGLARDVNQALWNYPQPCGSSSKHIPEYNFDRKEPGKDFHKKQEKKTDAPH